MPLNAGFDEYSYLGKYFTIRHIRWCRHYRQMAWTIIPHSLPMFLFTFWILFSFSLISYWGLLIRALMGVPGLSLIWTWPLNLDWGAMKCNDDMMEWHTRRSNRASVSYWFFFWAPVVWAQFPHFGSWEWRFHLSFIHAWEARNTWKSLWEARL